jgi:hypothetical protein
VTDFSANRYRGDRPPAAPHRDQHRLRRNIVVPQIVMNNLKMPQNLARFRAQRNNRVCVIVVTLRCPP